MDNVSQRLGLQQPDLFGLKYVSRKSYPKIRWVDLDRPLKKQLDRYSTKPYLFLGVIFYVTDVSLLEDEVIVIYFIGMAIKKNGKCSLYLDYTISLFSTTENGCGGGKVEM